MFERDTVRPSRHQIADSFKQSKQSISIHIGNVFKDPGLHKIATVKDYLAVQEISVF